MLRQSAVRDFVLRFLEVGYDGKIKKAPVRRQGLE
jgi:hypothetical protein